MSLYFKACHEFGKLFKVKINEKELTVDYKSLKYEKIITNAWRSTTNTLAIQYLLRLPLQASLANVTNRWWRLMRDDMCKAN